MMAVTVSDDHDDGCYDFDGCNDGLLIIVMMTVVMAVMMTVMMAVNVLALSSDAGLRRAGRAGAADVHIAGGGRALRGQREVGRCCRVALSCGGLRAAATG